MPENIQIQFHLEINGSIQLYVECLMFARPYSRTTYLARRKRKGACLTHLVLPDTSLGRYSNIKEVNKDTGSIQ